LSARGLQLKWNILVSKCVQAFWIRKRCERGSRWIWPYVPTLLLFTVEEKFITTNSMCSDSGELFHAHRIATAIQSFPVGVRNFSYDGRCCTPVFDSSNSFAQGMNCFAGLAMEVLQK
jgi:hypothetical protein